MASKKPKAAKAKKAPAKKSAAKAKPAAKAKSAAPKPIKAALNKSTLVARISEQSGVESKSVKAVLEEATLTSVSKKGVGEFTLPGLMKVVAQKVPAKPKRFGKNPFTGQDQWFAAKPATVKVKVRALKKLKDAVL